MTLSPDDLRVLADRAIAAAVEAGEMIGRSRPREVVRKAGQASDASRVLTEVDRRSEQLILDHLTPTLHRFALGLLTEERADDGSRLTADHFWCVDPLDGTLPFIEGIPGHAVSIALVARDGTPVIGVVVDPVEATVWHAVAGAGAFRDGEPWTGATSGGADVLTVFADRSFLEEEDDDDVLAALEQVAGEQGLEGLRIRATAGAVMNAVGVLEHPPACYVKRPKPAGGGHLWDFAATACLSAEVGAVASDVHGQELDLNRADATSMNHRGVLFATDATLAQQIRRRLPRRP